MEEEKRTVTATEAPVQRPVEERSVTKHSASGAVVAKRVVYYVFGVIVALIALRFLFLLLGANRGSGFVDFLYDVSAVFVAPFNGIFGEPTFGVSYFETSSIIAVIIYALIALAIGKLLTINRSVN